jgi:hypothetical protein
LPYARASFRLAPSRSWDSFCSRFHPNNVTLYRIWVVSEPIAVFSVWYAAIIGMARSGRLAPARGRTNHMFEGIASCTDGGGGATIQRSGVKPATVLGFLFALSMAGVIAVPAQATDKDKLSLRGNCYPDNQFTIAGTGKTFASGEAKGKVKEVELETPDPAHLKPVKVLVKNLGGAEVELNFKTVINGDKSFQGALDVEIKWNDPTRTGGVKETKFFSGCAQEVQTESQPKLGGFEGEFEGGLVNFPFFNGTIKAGVGSVVVTKDESHSGKIEVDFSLQTGITCFEDNGLGDQVGDIELAKIALTNLSPNGFNINNFTRGEWSFPVGKSPTPGTPVNTTACVGSAL